MAKFTPEYIAQLRAEMQADERHDNEAGWITPQEYYELLDEIEKSHNFVDRLIEAAKKLVWWGNCCSQDDVKQSVEQFQAVAGEWMER